MTNKNVKAVYLTTASNGLWGKGLTIDESLKNAGVKKGIRHVVMAALFDDPTEEELNKLKDCIIFDVVFGTPRFYTENRTEEDNKLIEDYLVGWLLAVDKR